MKRIGIFQLIRLNLILKKNMQNNNSTYTMFEKYNHLGFNNPYYFVNSKGKFEIHSDFKSTIHNYRGNIKIDPVAIIEILNKGYMLADRTIIKNINKTPWMAKPSETLDKWRYAKIPEHGELDLSEKKIAIEFFQRICDEIKNYIGSKKRIGILLSGGMDSRIVAGALDYLIKTKELEGVNITGFTWGNEGSRDVVYAKEITSRLNWGWRHYKVTATDLLENINYTAAHGCEYSPIHLHAIPQIKKKNKDIEVFLAGSYGDSVGRAEYSGWKIKNVCKIESNITNPGYFLLKKTFKENVKKVYGDIKNYHDLFPTKNIIAQNERDYQLHYMRRMLNPCMNLLIDESTSFYQVFTNPNVFGYIWGISPERRTDLIYNYIFDYYIKTLSDIPWGRTGLKYGNKKGIPDQFKKEHHTYVNIIRNDLFEIIHEIIFNSDIFNLNIFNKNNISKMFSLERKYPTNNLRYLEKLMWIASLSKMLRVYNIFIPPTISSSKKYYNLLITFDYFKSAIRKNVGPYVKKQLQKNF